MEYENNNEHNNSIDYTNLSVIKMYGEDLTAKQYITNPAIARDDEITKMTIILLTPEKSALLVGKPGIGKTSIVEGLAYRIQKGMVPNALLGWELIKINITSLLGTSTSGGQVENRVDLLVKELDERGVYVMLSNHNTLLINELYKDYNIHIIEAKRSINSKGSKRGNVEELIITNYEVDTSLENL